MAIHQTRIEFLLQQYAVNNCTKKELLELFDWIGQQKDDTNLKNAMDAVWQDRNDTDIVPVIDKDKVYARIMQISPGRENIKRWRGWVKLAAAAVFLLVAAGIIYLISNRTSEKSTLANIHYKGDVAPGHNGAVLTLSNGQKIVLDSAGNGELVKDANIAIIKKDGEITYQGKTNELVYNIISTCKGRQWQLSLPDGTRVWLNAASSIRYPLSFTGKERRVEITGEAYFEVKPLSPSGGQKIPFIVSVNNMKVEVLGTHFNINAYNDEANVKTTLLEGSVKVSGNKEMFLRPGQQAQYLPSGEGKVIDNIDTEEAIAWKDGLFKFNGGSVETIMRQIGRWYNINVVYEGPVPDKQIHGTASRNTNLSSIVKVLSLSGIHIQLEENRIIVKP